MTLLGDCHPRPVTALGSFLGALLCLGGAANAQEAGGLEAGLDVSQKFVFSESETVSLSTLGFGLSSETRSQYLRFRVQGGYETSLDGTTGSGLVDPDYSLAYGTRNRNAALDVSLAFTERDVDSIFELTEVPGVFVIDSGTRTSSRSSVQLELGREAPFGATIGLAYNIISYDGTTDPDLLDSRESEANVALRFDIDRRITARVDGSFSEIDSDGGTDVTRERVGVGADLQVTQTLAADVSVGVTRVTEGDAGTTTVQDGLSFGLTLSEERPDGAWTASLTSDIDESGRRSTLTLGRSLDLRDGRFSATIGVSEGDDGELRPLYSLRYNAELPNGSAGVVLDQSFDVNSSGFETLNTRLTADWEYQLNRVSSLGAEVRLRQTDVLGGSGDSSRLDLSLTYVHALTDDWSLTSGYTHTLRRKDGEPDSSTDELFIGLQTSFAWRP